MQCSIGLLSNILKHLERAPTGCWLSHQGMPFRHMTFTFNSVCVTGALPLLKQLLGSTDAKLQKAAARAIQRLERP